MLIAISSAIHAVRRKMSWELKKVLEKSQPVPAKAIVLGSNQSGRWDTCIPIPPGCGHPTRRWLDVLRPRLAKVALRHPRRRHLTHGWTTNALG